MLFCFSMKLKKGRGKEKKIKKSEKHIKTGARKKEGQSTGGVLFTETIFQTNSNTSIFYLSEYHEHLFCTSELRKHISELVFPGA